MNANEFRAELVKIMPGYKWTVHKPFRRYEVEDAPPPALVATGVQSSGSNRLSTLEIIRRERDGSVHYTAKSSGYGTRSKWMAEVAGRTLARALRGLQDHYENKASTYRSLAGALKCGRAAQGAKP